MILLKLCFAFFVSSAVSIFAEQKLSNRDPENEELTGAQALLRAVIGVTVFVIIITLQGWSPP